MSDINLLPDDLRKEEENLQKKGFANSAEPVDFHLPSKKDNQPIQQTEKKFVSDVNIIGSAGVRPLVAGSSMAGGMFTDIKGDEALDNEILAKKSEPKKRSGLFGGGQKKSSKGKILSNHKEKISAEVLTDEKFDVNLIPEGSDLQPTDKLLKNVAIYLALGVLMVTLVNFGLVLFGRQLLAKQISNSDNISKTQSTLNDLKAAENQAIFLNKKTQHISGLFENQVHWSQFLKFLEQQTIPEVYYTGIESSADGLVILSARTDNYTSVARQYLALQNADESILEVIIGNMAGDPSLNEVSFEILLALDPSIYHLVKAE